MKIALFIADRCEFEPLEGKAAAYHPVAGSFFGLDSLRFSAGEKEVLAIRTLIGKTAAASAAALAVAAFGPDAAINVGHSGCVCGFSKGDFVAGSSYIECDFDLSPLGKAPGEKPDTFSLTEAPEDLLAKAVKLTGGRSGAMGSGDFFLADNAVKERYRELFGISCFDMETGAQAWTLKRLGVPYVAVRRISDDAGEKASEKYTDSTLTLSTGLADAALALIEVL
ncbi:MAG: hypothetical protein K6C36_03870 [Clostridia bacterium]|nr:hypothetical protein [Clostridia bacterium]